MKNKKTENNTIKTNAKNENNKSNSNSNDNEYLDSFEISEEDKENIKTAFINSGIFTPFSTFFSSFCFTHQTSFFLFVLLIIFSLIHLPFIPSLPTSPLHPYTFPPHKHTHTPIHYQTKPLTSPECSP